MFVRSSLQIPDRDRYNSRNVSKTARPRVAVVFNRDYEGAEADPENRAREDILNVAEDVTTVLREAGYTDQRIAELRKTGEERTQQAEEAKAYSDHLLRPLLGIQDALGPTD